MRRVLLAAASTVAGLVALLSFKTHPATTPAAASATTPTTTGSTSSTSNPSTGSHSSADSSTSGNSSTSGTTTVTGDEEETRYGPVQVKITVTNGKVTSVDATEYPTERAKDEQINSYAIPELNKEAESARSANIDMISGATYTSTGYIDSLQSALTKAGLS